MDASQYKDYVLVFLFLRYVSDRAKAGSFELDVPEGGSFDDLVKLKGDKQIGDKTNKVIGKLAKANDLVGVIDTADYNDPSKLGTGEEMVDRLSELIGIFENPALDFSGNHAGTHRRPPGDAATRPHDPRELERDGLVLDDRTSELHALLGVVERVLVGRARDADRLRARTDRRSPIAGVGGRRCLTCPSAPRRSSSPTSRDRPCSGSGTPTRYATRWPATTKSSVPRSTNMTEAWSRPPGDGLHAVFGTARDAVLASIDAQRALAADSWPLPEHLRVRMGVHAGEAEIRDGDYYGTAVNRTTRIAGHIARTGVVLRAPQ
jgi:hypothetical protein